MLYVIWTATKTEPQCRNQCVNTLFEEVFFADPLQNGSKLCGTFKLGEPYGLMSIKSNRNVSTQNINNSKSRKHHLQLPAMNVVELLCQPLEVLFIVCDKQNNANLFMARVMSMHKFQKRTWN